MKKSYRLVFASAFIVFLSACGAPDLEDANSDPGWANAMQNLINEGDDFVKTVLADSVITDIEYQEALKKIESCYATHNAKVSYDPYGFETVESLDGVNDPLDVMGECAFADGGIVVLYYQIKQNPDNQDRYEIIAACLVRSGVVDKNFTAQDLKLVLETSAIPPWAPGDKRFTLCGKDPLGIITGNSE